MTTLPPLIVELCHEYDASTYKKAALSSLYEEDQNQVYSRLRSNSYFLALFSLYSPFHELFS